MIYLTNPKHRYIITHGAKILGTHCINISIHNALKYHKKALIYQHTKHCYINIQSNSMQSTGMSSHKALQVHYKKTLAYHNTKHRHHYTRHSYIVTQSTDISVHKELI